MSFKTDVDFNGLKKFDNYINQLQRIKKIQTDKNFQKYIQQKCMETLERVMNVRLDGGTSNDDSITLYKNSNHLIEVADGFIIYNDAKIPANVKGVQNTVENYPNGEFSIALAFEYGVGIIGMNTDFDPEKYTPWDYNIQDYNFGWILPKDVFDRPNLLYGGYQGFEIYRYTAEQIMLNLKGWVETYLDK